MVKRVLPTDIGAAAELGRSPDATPEQLEAMAISNLPFLRESAAAHPRTTPSVLERLTPDDLGSEVKERIAYALAVNPVTPPSVLTHLCNLLDAAMLDGNRREHGFHQRLALRLLKHPNCPSESASGVIDRSGRGLRLQLAKSITSEVLLARLSQDRSSKVAAAAQRRLGDDQEFDKTK